MCVPYQCSIQNTYSQFNNYRLIYLYLLELLSVCDTSPASVTDHELNLLVTIARSKRIRVDPDAVIAAVRAEVEQEAVVAASKVEACEFANLD